MIPKTLSASSISTSSQCLVRWKAENFDKAPQMRSNPAAVGTACHYALEKFVQAVYLDGTKKWEDVEYLNAMYELGYMETFQSGDFKTPQFVDGAQMIANWYQNYQHGLFARVISCEVKENFPIKTSIGDIPFNYIWDRADEIIPDEEYEVIDYKTFRAYVPPEDLPSKPQVRAYGVAAQVKWPQAKRIRVTLDLLRYGPVSVTFTRDDNVDSYRWLQREAERIIAADPDNLVAQVNPDCKWCIFKSNCPELLKMAELGHPIAASAEELAERHMKITSALEALKYAKQDLDAQLLKEAEARNDFDWNEGDLNIKLTARSRRVPNSPAISNIVGPELSAKYGNFTATNVDLMLKNEDLDFETVSKIKNEISKTWSEPTPKVKRIS